MSFLSSITLARAQNDTIPYYNKTLSRNNISIEVGGRAILGSVGYERTIYRSKKIILSLNVHVITDFSQFMLVPVGINCLYGEKKNKLVIGMNVTNSFDFTPYPATKKEREIYLASGMAEHDQYDPPYQLVYIMPAAGYRRYFKKGNSLTLNYYYLIYGNSLGKFRFSGPGSDILFPWFGLNYNIRF